MSEKKKEKKKSGGFLRFFGMPVDSNATQALLCQLHTAHALQKQSASLLDEQDRILAKLERDWIH